LATLREKPREHFVELVGGVIFNQIDKVFDLFLPLETVQELDQRVLIEVYVLLVVDKDEERPDRAGEAPSILEVHPIEGKQPVER